MSKRQGLFVSILVPLSLVVLWHARNRGLPIVDAGHYFWVPQRIVLALREHGWSAFFHALYFERIWKPILHPIFGVPALLVTDGNVLASVGLTTSLLYAAFVASVYRFAIRCLSPARATVFAIALGTMPWLLASAQTFNSELPLLACVGVIATAVYDAFEKRTFRACVILSLWLGVALCIRPVETLLSLGLPILLLLWSLRPIDRRHAVVVVVPFALAAVWFGPFESTLRNWIYQCTVGPLAQATGGRAASGLEGFVRQTIFGGGGGSMLAVGGIWLALAARKSLLRDRAFLAGALAASLPLLAGLMSYNNDPRYYYVSWLALVGWPCLELLRNGTKPAAAAIALLAVVQYAQVAAATFDLPGMGVLGRGIWTIPQATPGVEYDVQATLERHLNRVEANRIALFLIQQSGPTQVDPWALTVANQSAGRHWEVDYPWLARVDDFNAHGVKALVEQGFTYALIGPEEARYPMNDAFHGDASQAGNLILRRYAESGGYPGFEFVDKIVLRPGDPKRGTYYLARVARDAKLQSTK